MAMDFLYSYIFSMILKESTPQFYKFQGSQDLDALALMKNTLEAGCSDVFIDLLLLNVVNSLQESHPMLY